MINKKAAEYTMKTCEKDKDFLAIYEAYQDGWKDGQQPENYFKLPAIIFFMFLGAGGMFIIIGILFKCHLLKFTN